VGVDDAELPVFRFYQRANINAAFTAEEKVCRSQAESITIQKFRISD